MRASDSLAILLDEMEAAEDDDDLKLAKASTALLATLESDLPKLLWKPFKHGRARRRAHTHVKRCDLGHLTGLIESFQGEPQLLDAKLKAFLPPIIEAYLDFLQQADNRKSVAELNLETAVCGLLYTFCKVRGYKIIVGFLNNEPRFFELILEALERTCLSKEDKQSQWQVPYILLLWLSHLLLTPFDLISISNKPGPKDLGVLVDGEFQHLPPLTYRILSVGIYYLYGATKAQDAAASMIVRLSKRPDVLSRNLADKLVNDHLLKLRGNVSASQDVHEIIGSLRLIAGVSASAELGHLVPGIYETCEHSFDVGESSMLLGNAVAKKIVVKIFRNVAILSLRSEAIPGPLLDLIHSTSVLEPVIDYLLRSLGDKDTPVRYAAAKAISLIVLELDPELAPDVIQAILDEFKEDMPRSTAKVDFTTVDALKWHGLTLALAHTLFKRSAVPEQLPDILDALVSALQFQQRTATGSTLGTNVRDAANFGIWSLARRYTTSELLSVNMDDLTVFARPSGRNYSIIQHLAIQLILSACLDPAGNIRRGSSAALQELVGRHPDEIYEGITLVQVVDYQAVSLRNRAMVDVAGKAAALHPMYWRALLDGLFGWRGLGSADVPSRESAAHSISRLSLHTPLGETKDVLEMIAMQTQSLSINEIERMHGLALTAACTICGRLDAEEYDEDGLRNNLSSLNDTFGRLQKALQDFPPRVLRSGFPLSMARFLTALCRTYLAISRGSSYPTGPEIIPIEGMDHVTDRLLSRYDDGLLQLIPDLVQSMLQLKRAINVPLTCIDSEALVDKVAIDGSKDILHSAGKAIALGSLVASYELVGLNGEKATSAIRTLSNLLSAASVGSRVIGARSLHLAVLASLDDSNIDSNIADSICLAIHKGLNDYTIDERGDVGSLVRLPSIACANTILSSGAMKKHQQLTTILAGDILRLSLEKLDRVRFSAAQCRAEHLDFDFSVSDVGSVSLREYFQAALVPLTKEPTSWASKALFEGCISCAGVGSEPILQATREVLVSSLSTLTIGSLEQLMTTYSTIMKDQLVSTANTQPSLEVLAFLLDMQIPQRLACSTNFKWRNLLSTVQKSHHKSNDIPKILAAVHVYGGLAEIPTVRTEVLKKLISMLKTNPYPRVRVAVAETLWVVLGDDNLKSCDWTRPPSQHASVIEALRESSIGI